MPIYPPSFFSSFFHFSFPSFLNFFFGGKRGGTFPFAPPPKYGPDLTTSTNSNAFSICAMCILTNFFYQIWFLFNRLKVNDINRQYKFQRGAFMMFSTVVKMKPNSCLTVFYGSFE